MISKSLWKPLTYTCTKTKNLIKVNQLILNLKRTLVNGQAFNWYPYPSLTSAQQTLDLSNPSILYHGVLKYYYIQFGIDNQNYLYYKAFPDDDQIQEILYDYFQFDYDYNDLIQDWNQRDHYFKQISSGFLGLRILRQDPFECLISFICSQNNNIPRITKLISELKKKYGTLILNEGDHEIYSFPTLDQLIKATEKELRDMGFGYRARYIVETVEMIKNKGGYEWLVTLRGKDSKIVREELCKLKGIGNKVADCIALFSLDCKDVIPVDTHVFQIYEKIYKQSKIKSLTKNNYDIVTTFFKERFGEYAGWAHSYLFTSDLASFKTEIKVTNRSTKRKIMNDELEIKVKKSTKKVKTSNQVKNSVQQTNQ